MSPRTHAERVLEWERVLGLVADQCQTGLARELALGLQVSFDEPTVKEQLADTAEAFTLLGSESLPALDRLQDVREVCILASKGAVVSPVALYQVGVALSVIRQFRTAIQAKKDQAPRIHERCLGLHENPRTEQRLLDSLDADGEVRNEASQELARLRQTKKSAQQRMLDRIQSYTGAKYRDYLSDAVYTQRDGRYVIPVKSEHRGKVRGIVHDTSSSGQTIYVEPEDVVQLGNSLREAEVAEKAEVQRILKELSERVGADGVAIAASVQALGELDLIFAKARYGYVADGCLPRIQNGQFIEVEGGKHPLLDPAIAIPLTLEMGHGVTGLLITGPNTGGKTVCLKTVGLFVLMAQSGIPLPAGRVSMGVFSQVWADIGDEQSLQQSLSTFSGHIKNIAEALKHLQKGALVLLDEVGAGTDPAEGSALAKAILLEIQRKGALVLASTHYGELKLFAYNTEGFANAAMEFDLKTLRPTYRFLMGAPGASHALKIAERYGISTAVLEKARETHGESAQEIAKMLSELETAQKRARQAQSEADRLTHRLKQVEEQAEDKIREADEAKQKVRARVAGEFEETLRQLRLQAAEIFEEIKKNPTQQGIDQAREKLRSIQEKGHTQVAKLKPTEKHKDVPKVEKGSSVRVRGFSQIGVVLEEPKNGKALVQVGMVKMSFPIHDLELAGGKPEAPKPKTRPNLGLAKAQAASAELSLRQMRAEDAQHALEKYIDDAILAGFPFARIVHGKGEGILRKITHDFLRGHPGVKSVRLGEAGEGGDGVTIATFK